MTMMTATIIWQPDGRDNLIKYETRTLIDDGTGGQWCGPTWRVAKA